MIFIPIDTDNWPGDREGLSYLLYTVKPFSYELVISLALFPHRHMTGVLKGHPLGLWDLPEVIRGDEVLGEVLTAVDNKRRNSNFV